MQLTYRRIEVQGGDMEWYGPVRKEAQVTTALAARFISEWNELGLKGPCSDGDLDPDMAYYCLFAWTERGWNYIGCKTYERLKHLKVRVAHITGTVMYKDINQVAIKNWKYVSGGKDVA